eukprot:9558824-Alexandrium_andersonii.AAC.1
MNRGSGALKAELTMWSSGTPAAEPSTTAELSREWSSAGAQSGARDPPPPAELSVGRSSGALN